MERVEAVGVAAVGVAVVGVVVVGVVDAAVGGVVFLCSTPVQD